MGNYLIDKIMGKFILDVNPKFGSARVNIGTTTYELKMIKNNGCHVTILENGIDKDQISLTRTDMLAFYLLLTSNKNGK